MVLGGGDGELLVLQVHFNSGGSSRKYFDSLIEDVAALLFPIIIFISLANFKQVIKHL